MDKKRKNENDEISQLLDSFQTNEEDTLEQKMDQFTKNQTRSRVEKHKPEPEIPFQAKKEEPSLGDTFVVGSKDLNEPKEDLSATRTVMWNADDLKQEADSTNQTVVIDDDEIQSFLMSFARGDLIKFSKFGPQLDVIHPKLIPRIKPLWNTPEKEVGTWAILNDINIHLDECPYSHLSLRAKIKDFLNNNEDKYPGIKNNIMESFQKILTFESDIPSNLNECRLCGEPTSSDICKACELKKLISENHEGHI